MRFTSFLLVTILVFLCLGCSGMSNIERESLTKPEAREDYILKHPEGKHNECIRNGEIIRGMDIYEVIASWGLPNVYLAPKEEPWEYWIYYIQHDDSRVVLVYTLTFGDDLLKDWSIDQKRFVHNRIASEMTAREDTPAMPRPVKKKY